MLTSSPESKKAVADYESFQTAYEETLYKRNELVNQVPYGGRDALQMWDEGERHHWSVEHMTEEKIEGLRATINNINALNDELERINEKMQEIRNSPAYAAAHLVREIEKSRYGAILENLPAYLDIANHTLAQFRESADSEQLHRLIEQLSCLYFGMATKSVEAESEFLALYYNQMIRAGFDRDTAKELMLRKAAAISPTNLIKVNR